MLTFKEITKLGKSDLKGMPTKKIVEIYNTLAKPIGVKVVKNFKDKTLATTRTIEAIEAYILLEKHKATPAAEVKSEAKSFENETYAIGPNVPKHNESAMGVLCWLVEGEGVNEYTTLAENFIEEYKGTYQGVKDVNMSFARGYIKGALRDGHLVIIEE